MASRSSYKEYKERHPDSKLSYTEWANIIYTYNYNFRDYLLETGDKASLPWGMGWFAIAKRKMVNFKEVNGKLIVGLPINWQRWKETGKKVYHENNHTETFRFKWKCFHGEGKFKFSEIWNFMPYRECSRLLTHYLAQEGYQYKYQEW